MKTHFDPYSDIDDDPPGVALCGTTLGDDCSLTTRWAKVTCKRCLRSRARITKQYEEQEKFIVQKMGDMAWIF